MSNDSDTHDGAQTDLQTDAQDDTTTDSAGDLVVSTAETVSAASGVVDDDGDDDGDAQGDDDDDDDEDADDPLVREGDVAGDYLERLLDILDLDGDIDLDVEGERAVVAVVGGDLQHLVGPQGQTLDALQELTRLAVTTQTGNRSRLMLDIDGYRQSRREQLTDIAAAAGREVLDNGRPKELRAMNPFERKVVHDAIAALDGVISESTGEEPNRRVVVLPSA